MTRSTSTRSLRHAVAVNADRLPAGVVARRWWHLVGEQAGLVSYACQHPVGVPV